MDKMTEERDMFGRCETREASLAAHERLQEQDEKCRQAIASVANGLIRNCEILIAKLGVGKQEEEEARSIANAMFVDAFCGDAVRSIMSDFGGFGQSLDDSKAFKNLLDEYMYMVSEQVQLR